MLRRGESAPQLLVVVRSDELGRVLHQVYPVLQERAPGGGNTNHAGPSAQELRPSCQYCAPVLIDLPVGAPGSLWQDLTMVHRHQRY